MAWRDSEDLLPLTECWTVACHYFCARARVPKGKGHNVTGHGGHGADGGTALPEREAGAAWRSHRTCDAMGLVCGNAMVVLWHF
jgi:hypothetical protein